MLTVMYEGQKGHSLAWLEGNCFKLIMGYKYFDILHIWGNQLILLQTLLSIIRELIPLHLHL